MSDTNSHAHPECFLSVLARYQEARGRRAEAENDREANQKTATHVEQDLVLSEAYSTVSCASPLVRWCRIFCPIIVVMVHEWLMFP